MNLIKNKKYTLNLKKQTKLSFHTQQKNHTNSTGNNGVGVSLINKNKEHLRITIFINKFHLPILQWGKKKTKDILNKF